MLSQLPVATTAPTALIEPMQSLCPRNVPSIYRSSTTHHQAQAAFPFLTLAAGGLGPGFVGARPSAFLYSNCHMHTTPSSPAVGMRASGSHFGEAEELTARHERRRSTPSNACDASKKRHPEPMHLDESQSPVRTLVLMRDGIRSEVNHAQLADP